MISEIAVRQSETERKSAMWKSQVSGSFSPRCWRSALTSSHCESRVKMLLDSILSLSRRTLFRPIRPRSATAHSRRNGARAYATRITHTHTHVHRYLHAWVLWGPPRLTLRSPKIPLELRAPSCAANRTEIITGRWACVDCSYSASLTDSENSWGKQNRKSTQGNREEFHLDGWSCVYRPEAII